MTIEQKIEAAAKRLVEMGVFDEPLKVKVETVQAVCCAVFQVSIEELLSPRRYEEIAVARQASMQICREKLQLTLNRIGETHGNRDHGTVLHAARRVADLLETNKDFKRRYELAIQLLTTPND